MASKSDKLKSGVNRASKGLFAGMTRLDEKETKLSLFVKNRAEVKPGLVVLRDEFTPPPKVDSQVLVLEPYQDGPNYPDEMFKLVKMAFSSPRKKLMHNISALKSHEEMLGIFEKLKISEDARPADLHLDDYYNLWSELK